ncbi:skin secretory protein xP2-like [Melozone crissalis]|uniref:skin secretory protein xP2-like n=1 Tax=Melozone crissalis TaxID=40204 RepID=UPI0023DBEA10|nr:skin secretory protein xP2-like [Melozone crissalis]
MEAPSLSSCGALPTNGEGAPHRLPAEGSTKAPRPAACLQAGPHPGSRRARPSPRQQEPDFRVRQSSSRPKAEGPPAQPRGQGGHTPGPVTPGPTPLKGRGQAHPPDYRGSLQPPAEARGRTEPHLRGRPPLPGTPQQAYGAQAPACAPLRDRPEPGRSAARQHGRLQSPGSLLQPKEHKGKRPNRSKDQPCTQGGRPAPIQPRHPQSALAWKSPLPRGPLASLFGSCRSLLPRRSALEDAVALASSSHGFCQSPQPDPRATTHAAPQPPKSLQLQLDSPSRRPAQSPAVLGAGPSGQMKLGTRGSGQEAAPLLTEGSSRCLD